MIETRRVDSTLALDAPTLAKIFNGTITRWDDPAITRLNQSMQSQPITVVYRSDDSGTSETFQRYLTQRRMGVGQGRGPYSERRRGTQRWCPWRVCLCSRGSVVRFCNRVQPMVR